ncbi:MAG: vWA domain-containing protein [Myxococcales bacterium]
MKRTALIFALAASFGMSALLLWLVPALRHGPAPVAAPEPPAVPTPPTPPVTPLLNTGGPLTLRATLSDPFLHAGGLREVFLKIDLDAEKAAGSERAPVNLALVLDRSGSMAGDKIEHARRAARHLVAQLNERDRFALVTFGSEVTTLVESVQATPEAKQRLMAAIDGISEIGGTNISGGVEAGLAAIIAYKSRYAVSRLVLLSDGQANEGIVSPEGLSALSRKVNAQGVILSAIGVGLDFNEHVMESMADYGGGAYHFLSDSEQLAAIFDRELQQATRTVASSPVLTIRPKGGTLQEVYGYLSEQDGGVMRVRLPDFAAGEHRKVVVRMLVPASSVGALAVADVSVDYADVTRDRAPATAALSVGATVTPDFQLAAQNRNKDVAAVAAHAEAVKGMREAGKQYAQGRRSEAEAAIRQARKKLEAAKSTLGSYEEFEQAEGEARAFEDAVQSYAAPSAAAKRIHSYSNQAR